MDVLVLALQDKPALPFHHIFHKEINGIGGHSAFATMMRCKEKIVITLPLLGRMCFIQISFEQFNHRGGDWNYSQFISLSSKADCCMSLSNAQIMNFCIHQFLATCCGVVHQPHKAEVTVSIRLEAVGLLKKSFQCRSRQKLHDFSRSFPNRNIADFDLHIDFAGI